MKTLPRALILGLAFGVVVELNKRIVGLEKQLAEMSGGKS